MDKDETKAEEKVVEETTPQTSPAAEEPTTEVQTTEEPVEVSDEPKEMSPEARKAFQEQRLEIKRLKEEQETRKQSESAFAPFRPQPSAGVDVNRFTDPNTGMTDWNAYNGAVAQDARAVASQAANEQIDEFKAREKHPDLFGDPETERLIADTWLAAKMRGENLPVTSIADRLAKRFGKAVSKAEKIGAEKMLQEVSTKEQATMAPAPSSSGAERAQEVEDLDKLKIQSRGRGRDSEEAVAQRMKSVPWK